MSEASDKKVARGYWAVREVAERLAPVAKALLETRGGGNVHLALKDFDLVDKRRAAAESLGFSFDGQGIAYGGVLLLRHVGRGRYKQQEPRA